MIVFTSSKIKHLIQIPQQDTSFQRNHNFLALLVSETTNEACSVFNPVSSDILLNVAFDTLIVVFDW